MVFCLGAEGSKSSLLRNGWFQCFSVKEFKVPMVPYLEMGGSIVFLFGNLQFLNRKHWNYTFLNRKPLETSVSRPENNGNTIFWTGKH